MLNIIEMNVGTIISCIVGYLLGSVNFGIVISKFKRVDIKKFGSGNPGATNISRYLGKKTGQLVAILDGFKPVFAAFFSMLLLLINSKYFIQTSLIIPGFFALLGHCFSIYQKFKGGKAVSCYVGMLLISNWVLAVSFVLIWLVIFKIDKRVSFASIITSVITAGLLWIPILSGSLSFFFDGSIFYNIAYSNYAYLNVFNLYYLNFNGFIESFFTINIFVTLSSILLILRHSSNIKKMLLGQELNYKESKLKAQEELERLKNEEKK